MQSKEDIARKTRLLLDIATAGKSVQEVIAANAAELDFAAVRLLEKRIQVAHRCAPGCPSSLVCLAMSL
jgi:hypothetical protein